jgi:hypothetical protein
MTEAPFQLLEAVMAELDNAQRVRSHRNIAVAPAVAPANQLKDREEATGATGNWGSCIQSSDDACMAVASYNCDASVLREARVTSLFRKTVVLVAPVAPAQEVRGFAGSHRGLECGSNFVACGSEVNSQPSLRTDGSFGFGNTQVSVGHEPGQADIPQEWVAGIAMMLHRRSPSTISRGEWDALMDGAIKLLTDWGKTLASLGWTTADLFAVHRIRPLIRVDYAGLARFTTRDRVTAVTTTNATLQCSTGALQTYWRRSPQDSDWIPLWKLPLT